MNITMKQITQDIRTGLGIGCFIFTIMTLIFALLSQSEDGMRIASYALASLGTGLSFGVFAFAWRMERFSRWTRFAIGFIPPVIIYLLIAIAVHWIPLGESNYAVAISLVFCIIVPFVISSIIFAFNYKTSRQMNERLHILQEQKDHEHDVH